MTSLNQAFHLAQVNVARARAPLDDPLLAEFMAQLDRINALADRSPGFVWRLQSDSGNATDILVSDDPCLLVNLSVWSSVEALFDFVYKTGHSRVMARRKDWFEPFGRPFQALWWVPAGQLPSPEEAMARLDLLAEQGPCPEAFTFKRRFPPPVERTGEVA
jgi:hypothetical protein